MPNVKPSDTDILAVIERLYEAVLDDSSLQPALAGAARLIGEEHGALMRWDRTPGEAPSCIARFSTDSTHFDSWTGQYDAHYHQYDPTIDSADTHASGSLFISSREISKPEQARSTYLQEFCLPNGFSQWLSLRIVNGPAQFRLAIQQSRGMPDITDDSIALLSRLLPHLRQVLTLREQNIELRHLAACGLGALNLFNNPVWILESNGRIHFTNKSCDASWVNQLMRGKQQQLQPQNHAYVDCFRRLLLKACTGTPQAGILTLDDGIGNRYCLHLMPIPPHLPVANDSNKTLALILLQGGPFSSQGLGQTLAQLYGFTPAEIRLSIDLLANQTTEEMADSHSVKVSTVRMQIKSMLAKSNCRRQTELVRLLASFCSL